MFRYCGCSPHALPPGNPPPPPPRLQQASFYAGPSPYDNCFWRSQPWPWSDPSPPRASSHAPAPLPSHIDVSDPISAGDFKGNAAHVLSSEQPDALHASCVIVPMQWACDNVCRA
jgi:hypothetical protein